MKASDCCQTTENQQGAADLLVPMLDSKALRRRVSSESGLDKLVASNKRVV